MEEPDQSENDATDVGRGECEGQQAWIYLVVDKHSDGEAEAGSVRDVIEDRTMPSRPVFSRQSAVEQVEKLADKNQDERDEHLVFQQYYGDCRAAAHKIG